MLVVLSHSLKCDYVKKKLYNWTEPCDVWTTFTHCALFKLLLTAGRTQALDHQRSHLQMSVSILLYKKHSSECSQHIPCRIPFGHHNFLCGSLMKTPIFSTGCMLMFWSVHPVENVSTESPHYQDSTHYAIKDWI